MVVACCLSRCRMPRIGKRTQLRGDEIQTQFVVTRGGFSISVPNRHSIGELINGAPSARESLAA